MKDGMTVVVRIKVKFSWWDALKLRLAKADVVLVAGTVDPEFKVGLPPGYFALHPDAKACTRATPDGDCKGSEASCPGCPDAPKGEE